MPCAVVLNKYVLWSMELSRHCEARRGGGSCSVEMKCSNFKFIDGLLVIFFASLVLLCLLAHKEVIV
jgi:hypothetical protein